MKKSAAVKNKREEYTYVHNLHLTRRNETHTHRVTLHPLTASLTAEGVVRRACLFFRITVPLRKTYFSTAAVLIIHHCGETKVSTVRKM